MNRVSSTRPLRGLLRIREDGGAAERREVRVHAALPLFLILSSGPQDRVSKDAPFMHMHTGRNAQIALAVPPVLR